ncbi:MAG TPA: adenylate/guanylate cyclase domain-containing protein [Vicinamibacterales bacterium]|nr:adenylate/guanylate cyclase domain-containing protein [Vicinamibacterales bacterium]
MRNAIAGLIVGLAAGTVVLGLALLFARQSAGGLDPLQSIEFRTYDWRLTRTADPASARQDLALVEIDEYSLRNLQPNAGRWPWPRAVHSMLIDYLHRAPARVIAYDVDFAEADTRTGFDFGGDTWSGQESDAAFIDSVKKSGNVIMLADATYEGDASGSATAPDSGFTIDSPLVAERKTIFPPFQALADAVAGFGHNLFVLDPDGPIRHTVPFVRSGNRALPSLGLAAALKAAQLDPSSIRIDERTLHFGERTMPVQMREVRSAGGVRRYQWGLIDFRGPALLADMKSRPYPHYAFFDLLYSEEQILAGQKPNVDPAVFKDKIVFVGVSASGLYDVFETPFAGGKMPGIQVHAAVADDFLSGRYVAPAPDVVRVITVLAFALLIGVLATTVPAWWASAAVIVGLAVFGWAATRLFVAGYWVNITQPVLASAVTLFGGVAYQYFVEGREKRKMKRLFGQYVSKDVYAQLVANPDLARLGGQRRDMTVLFSDIRGFTTISERGQPEEIVHLLNEYFTRMVQIVFKHHGTVDKFVGDMVMALFGAPLDDPQHAEHAVETALEMMDELKVLNARWLAEGLNVKVDIGIGVNTGPMIAGNIGSDQIMSYTVIGDAVNLGSRLESLNKQYSTHIIISDETRKRLSGNYVFRPLGDVVVKGKTQPVAIFEVVGRAGADTIDPILNHSSAEPKEARV